MTFRRDDPIRVRVRVRVRFFAACPSGEMIVTIFSLVRSLGVTTSDFSPKIRELGRV